MGTTKSRKMTPQQKLISRRKKRLRAKIKQAFDKKFFIGDIAITDEEFELLLEATKPIVENIIKTGRGYLDSPILAVTLVQIGVRFYDYKGLWPYIEKAFDFSLTLRNRDLISSAFLYTLGMHRKYIPEDNTGCVRAILVHGFVSNFYSKGLFELLFSYYTHDLERDINRNTTEQMQALMDTLILKDGEVGESKENYFNQFVEHSSRRAYKLRAQTLQAISVQPVHSRVRLRRLLRLIDQAFWKGKVPKNPTSRLTILFKEWMEDSPSFTHEYKLYQSGEIRNRGKKHFSSPYLFADVVNGEFSLKLPAQLLPPAYADDLTWEIVTSKRSYAVCVGAYPALTGYKTEDSCCAISPEELFGGFQIQLLCGEERVRRFPDLPTKTVRFFDMDGDYSGKLFAEPMCAFSCAEEPLQSSALIDRISFGTMTRWDFEFEAGDIVIMPDGSGMMVGEIYTDGFLPRGKIPCAHYIAQDSSILPVYASLPELLLTLPMEKIPGTMLSVDGQDYSLGQCQLSSFSSEDAKGTRAILLSFSQFNICMSDGVHTVLLDIPGSNYARSYSFAYINAFDVDFVGSPYIFEERGAVVFPRHIRVKSDFEKIYGENGFQFELNGNTPALNILVNDSLSLELDIPLFSWSTDRETWHIAPAGDLWHKEFFRVQKLYLRSPEKKVSIFPNTEGLDDEDEADHRVIIPELGQDGIFTADLTRFRSWFTRDVICNAVLLKIGKKEVCLANVYTRSWLVSFDVQADYETDELMCNADIIGKSDYYVNIVHLESNHVLADKALLHDGQFRLKDRLRSGQYQFTVYEADEDDSGFDDLVYEELHSEVRKLVNRNDISGQVLSLQRFKAAHSSNLYTSFTQEYLIVNLEKSDRYTYTGDLLINREESDFRVEVKFPDKNDMRFMTVGFWDEEEGIYVPFLFDTQSGTLVKEENPGLRPSQRYRQYRMLDDYVFVFWGLTYAEKPPFDEEKYAHPRRNLSIASGLVWKEAPKAVSSIPIEKIGLSVRAYNSLYRAGIRTTADLDGMSMAKLMRVRNLGRDCAEEIVRLSSQYDFTITEQD